MQTLDVRPGSFTATQDDDGLSIRVVLAGLTLRLTKSLGYAFVDSLIDALDGTEPEPFRPHSNETKQWSIR